MRISRARWKGGRLNNVVVLDACTIVNLARIDDGNFLEDKVRALKAYAVEKVIDEVRFDMYLPAVHPRGNYIWLLIGAV